MSVEIYGDFDIQKALVIAVKSVLKEAFTVNNHLSDLPQIADLVDKEYYDLAKNEIDLLASKNSRDEVIFNLLASSSRLLIELIAKGYGKQGVFVVAFE